MDRERWLLVNRITADALEIDADLRAAFLDRECAGDPELRGEVDRILAAHPGFDDLLDGGVTEPAPSKDTGVRIVAPQLDTPGGASKLPLEIVERAARRVAMLAILFAVGIVIEYVVRELVVHVVGRSPYSQVVHTPGQILTAIFALLAIGVAVFARTPSRPATERVNVGLVFEVVGSLGIALISYSGLWRTGAYAWGVSWLCVWIMMSALVVQAPPRNTAIAAFASAATAPIAVLVWAATRNFTFPSTALLLGSMVPNFIVAALAWLGAQHIYRIALELRRARRFGQYRLVAPLGRGGMGEVWIAEHDLLARPVALKLIRPELLQSGRDSSEVISRFEREAHATSLLSSPHTVRLYDFGATDDGLFYYVMEALAGLDLETLVQRSGAVPHARAVRFLRHACASLAEAHALGLVHRDIKPSNLFVCRQGLEWDVVKVLDFGIVRPSAGRASASDGSIEGTPAFMAPEALRGIASPATDLYALGCVGYWLITGQLAFDGVDAAELARRHREDAPVPPSRRTGPVVPAELENALLACLEKDPARRPASAEALDARLAAVPGPAWSEDQALAWWLDREPGIAGASPPAVIA